MIILKPFTSNIDPQNRLTTNLHFEGGVVKKFYMRGAIAWPNGKKEGFALMAGEDLDTKKIIIFEQFRFWTIPHWLYDDGNVREREEGGYHLGLVQFISDNLSLYRCCSYFWGGQHIDVWTRHAREIYSNSQITRGIELIEVPYVSELGPDLLNQKIKLRAFKGEVESLLSQSIADFGGQSKDADYDNPTLALMNLLAGFEAMPWVKL